MSSINKVNEFLIKNKLTLTPIKEFQELIKKEKEMPMEYDLFYQNPSNPLELFYIPEIQNIIPYNREQVLIKFDKSKWITLPYNSKLLIFNNNLEKDLLKKFKELCRKAAIKISNTPSLRGTKVFEQWERFTKEFKEVEKAKELIKNYEVAYEILDNWLLNVKSKIFKDVNTELFDNIKEIKEQLFDAPVEVKKAFNDVVKYFSNDSRLWCIYDLKEAKVDKKGTWEDLSEEFKSNKKYRELRDKNEPRLGQRYQLMPYDGKYFESPSEDKYVVVEIKYGPVVKVYKKFEGTKAECEEKLKAYEKFYKDSEFDIWSESRFDDARLNGPGGMQVMFDTEGKCPEDGCIQEDPENKGLWMIISNKTGEPWKSRYESKEKAEEALKAYHASKH